MDRLVRVLSLTESDIRSVPWHCSHDHMVEKWQLHRDQPVTFLNSLDCINREIMSRCLDMSTGDFNLTVGFCRGIYCFFSGWSAQEIWADQSEKYWDLFSENCNRDGLRFYSALNSNDRKLLAEWYDRECQRYDTLV